MTVSVAPPSQRSALLATRPIIVADEDVDSRELVALQVSRHLPGRRVLVSRGGSHLLDLVNEERPETVVLSLGVPPYPTLRILHQVRRAAPVAHIVAMSNLVSRSDEQGAFVAGADRYLTKGVPVAKLLHSLQRDPIGQATSTLRA